MTRGESKILLQKARKLTKDDEEKAIKIYQNIIDVDASWSVPYYNLGLIYKYNRQWQKSYEFNKKATELDSKDEAAWWNLGMAATVLEKWREARIAWNQFGLELEVNDTEVEMDIGSTPIRLFNGEVVWATRICPARAIIDNIPLKESGHRYSDLILHDGSPNGVRMQDEVEYAVYDELQILEKSDYKTYSIGVKVDYPEAITTLREVCFELDYGFENWTHSIKMICKKCSEGVPHQCEEQELEPATAEYNLAIATQRRGELDSLLGAWAAENDVTIKWVE